MDDRPAMGGDITVKTAEQTTSVANASDAHAPFSLVSSPILSSKHVGIPLFLQYPSTEFKRTTEQQPFNVHESLAKSRRGSKGDNWTGKALFNSNIPNLIGSLSRIYRPEEIEHPPQVPAAMRM